MALRRICGLLIIGSSLFACSGDDDDPVAPPSPQPVAISPPTSERLTIDLSAGMPGQTHWRYIKGQDQAARPSGGR